MGSGSSRRTANENGLLGGAVQPQGSIVVLFNRIANGNSTISFNDFKIQCNMNSNVVVKQLFRAFDQDNDGVISFFDFHSAMQLFLNVNVCFNEQLKCTALPNPHTYFKAAEYSCTFLHTPSDVHNSEARLQSYLL